jgi:hypothetical protein
MTVEGEKRQVRSDQQGCEHEIAITSVRLLPSTREGPPKRCNKDAPESVRRSRFYNPRGTTYTTRISRCGGNTVAPESCGFPPVMARGLLYSTRPRRSDLPRRTNRGRSPNPPPPPSTPTPSQATRLPAGGLSSCWFVVNTRKWGSKDGSRNRPRCIWTGRRRVLPLSEPKSKDRTRTRPSRVHRADAQTQPAAGVPARQSINEV